MSYPYAYPKEFNYPQRWCETCTDTLPPSWPYTTCPKCQGAEAAQEIVEQFRHDLREKSDQIAATSLKEVQNAIKAVVDETKKEEELLPTCEEHEGFEWHRDDCPFCTIDDLQKRVRALEKRLGEQ